MNFKNPMSNHILLDMSTKNIHSNDSTPRDLTERICQALHEVKMMQEGKNKELSMNALLDEL